MIMCAGTEAMRYFNLGVFNKLMVLVTGNLSRMFMGIKAIRQKNHAIMHNFPWWELRYFESIRPEFDKFLNRTLMENIQSRQRSIVYSVRMQNRGALACSEPMAARNGCSFRVPVTLTEMTFVYGRNAQCSKPTSAFQFEHELWT